MVFRHGGILRYYEKWYYDGIEIETVSAYKYMSLFITPRLIWSYAKENLAIQAGRSIMSMLKCSILLDILSFQNYLSFLIL